MKFLTLAAGLTDLWSEDLSRHFAGLCIQLAVGTCAGPRTSPVEWVETGCAVVSLSRDKERM